MKAYTYIDKGKFELTDKPKPHLLEATDAIVRVTIVVSVRAICISSMAVCLVQ